MKQKKYFILAAAAILMAACSENDIAEKQNPQAQQTGEQAVEFGAFINRSTTRAGSVGTLTTASATTYAKNTYLKDPSVGFGVFGYYTNGENYSDNAKPDFMYNQQVKFTDPIWSYDPLKYWPNEFGQNAESEQQDKLTFFAYAPWVEMIPSTGRLKDVSGDKATYGIVGMTSNTAKGDPYMSPLQKPHLFDRRTVSAIVLLTASNP